MNNDTHEITGGEITDVPNERYVKFFEKFSEIDTIDIKDYKPVHFIAYFCARYADYYGVQYKFKFNSPAPSKCFEVFQIKKLASNVTAQPALLKEYIDWVFDNKIIKGKKRVTSISVLTQEETMKEYKMNVMMAANRTSNTISRAASLPGYFRSILDEAGYDGIQTYGDLAFLSQINDDKVENILNTLEATGQFKREILKKII